MKVKNNLIIVLDLFRMEEVMQLLEEISGQINTVKVGYPLVLSEGLQSISKIKETFGFNIQFHT